MPYKIDTLNLKLDRKHDRRVKYTDDDRENVKLLFTAGYSQRSIARETGISRRMVSFILFPERLETCRKQYKERRKDGRYYDKELNTTAVRECRRWRVSHIKISK